VPVASRRLQEVRSTVTAGCRRRRARKVRQMVQQQRAAATRAQIVRGAAQMFDRSGFESANLVEIAEAAGMTQGALYFHFRSKEDLARNIIAEQHRISLSAVQPIAAAAAGVGDRRRS
jgi:AcrR family transcriptional regulator